ncbi:PP2C family protein-serine/threonine phosphatase [Trueperella bialowiezensis]|uniref:PP2C-family Ser/Thr phosphatase n=1 Tax=Trueperella bialowiezensis TaxID=312285 RepID=A0A448PEL9_9ACTO|nr:protein phosphatase 2C domain-containing protein [Trueperella bialowiezensis]VEI13366.1 PP2C-family Ser/Thr phosphatase [Trueperella bialowiezensis]
MTINLRYTAMSDVGLIRKSNQDAGYASANLLVLADGMGGAAGGDIASSVVVAHLAEIDDVHQAEDLVPLLVSTLEEAHEDLIARAEEKAELAGLGTTCIAILRASNKLGMVHVGDSRAYLLRDNKLTQITRDHTLVQYLLDKGEITAEEAENHPKRNVIMRNIGDTPEPIELDESVREAVPGDRWLLASDGLFGVVSNESISQTLTEHEDLDECARELIDLALAAGAPDNVTVVLADVVDDDRTPDAKPVIVGSAAVDAGRPTRAGRSAAGSLARLRRRPEAEAEDSDVERAPGRWARLAAIVALVLLFGGGATGAYAWSQTQYYVAPAAGNIGIYKGVPANLGPITLSQLYERSDVTIGDLNQIARDRLEEPITRGSLEEARQVVDDLAKQEKPADPPATPADTSTPTGPAVFPSTNPSPSSSTTPSPSATSSGSPQPADDSDGTSKPGRAGGGS